jgi:hypothetical protein
MNARNQLALCLAGLFSTASVGTALADVDDLDTKIYPGHMCHADSSISGIGHWRGRAYNQRTDVDVWVGCPIVRDVVASGGRVSSAWVKVVDQHYTDDFVCGIWSQNSDSADGWSGYVMSRSSSGSSLVPQTLSFTSLNAYSSSAFYVMECLIPNVYSGNSSQLVAYSVTDD